MKSPVNKEKNRKSEKARRGVTMFQTGDYVVGGNKGVCLVKDITTLQMGGADKNRLYYVLKPVYSETSTVYIPVDTGQTSLRCAISGEQAARLLSALPGLEPIHIRDEKTVEMQYKECLHTNDCKELARLVKTLYFRNLSRVEKGHKITAVDGRYYKLAEESLCGELAVALGISRTEAEADVAERLKENGVML